jgi:hypothetical protein
MLKLMAKRDDFQLKRHSASKPRDNYNHQCGKELPHNNEIGSARFGSVGGDIFRRYPPVSFDSVPTCSPRIRVLKPGSLITKIDIQLHP